MPADDPHGSVPDEREIEAVALQRAMNAATRMAQGIHDIRMNDGRSAWDGAEIARSDFLIVEREARAALDRARDARRDEATLMEQHERATREYFAARSPQGEDHEAGIEDERLVELALAEGNWPRSEFGREKMARSLAAVLPYLSRVSPSPERDTARLDTATEIVQRLRQRAAITAGGEVEAAVIDECADFIEREYLAKFPDAPGTDEP